VIRAGCRVSALIGELGWWKGPPPVEVAGDDKQKKRRKYRERFFGTVVTSKPDRTWLIRWDRIGTVSEEGYSTFKLKYEGAGSDLRPTNQESAQQHQATAAATLHQAITAAAALHQDTTAAATIHEATTISTLVRMLPSVASVNKSNRTMAYAVVS
jgi:hypothetical protein